MELKEQIDMLRMMDDEYGVFGKSDGRGVAIRSEEPVDFHPLRKTSNVVCVPDLMDAMKQGAPDRYRAQVKDYYEELVK